MEVKVEWDLRMGGWEKERWVVLLAAEVLEEDEGPEWEDCEECEECEELEWVSEGRERAKAVGLWATGVELVIVTGWIAWDL